jgi:hypothetical protein
MAHSATGDGQMQMLRCLKSVDVWCTCHSTRTRQSQKVKKNELPITAKGKRERWQRQGGREGNRARLTGKMQVLYYVRLNTHTHTHTYVSRISCSLYLLSLSLFLDIISIRVYLYIHHTHTNTHTHVLCLFLTLVCICVWSKERGGFPSLSRCVFPYKWVIDVMETGEESLSVSCNSWHHSFEPICHTTPIEKDLERLKLQVNKYSCWHIKKQSMDNSTFYTRAFSLTLSNTFSHHKNTHKEYVCVCVCACVCYWLQDEQAVITSVYGRGSLVIQSRTD